MISREKAIEHLKAHLLTDNMFTHSLSVEFLMRGLAEHFEQDIDFWAMAGLMHDIDYEETENNGIHGPRGAKLLQDYGFPEEIARVPLTHTYQIQPDTLMDKALVVADALSGLVYASALMRPDRCISTMNIKSIKKKFKSKGFAAGANRENIRLCESWLDMDLNTLFQIAIKAMGRDEKELGLGN